MEEIKICDQCAWLKKPLYNGMGKCILKGVEVWSQSVACSEASEVGVF